MTRESLSIPVIFNHSFSDSRIVSAAYLYRPNFFAMAFPVTAQINVAKHSRCLIDLLI